jgi:hypothetical protein
MQHVEASKRLLPRPTGNEFTIADVHHHEAAALNTAFQELWSQSLQKTRA